MRLAGRNKSSLGVALAASLLTPSLMGCDDPLDLARNRTSASLVAYESCDALLTDLKAHTREQMRVQLLTTQEQLLASGGPWFALPGGAVDDAAGAPEAAAGDNGTRTEGVDFSGTNNQEQGVDEADFVKTDGYYLYVLNGGELRILGVPEFGQLTEAGRLDIEGYPQALLLDGDRAVVFSQVYSYELPGDHPLAVEANADLGYWRVPSFTKLTVVDLSADRLSPSVAKEIYLEGNYLTGREVEGRVRMASYASVDLHELQYWPNVDYNEWNLFGWESHVRDATAAAIAHNDGVIAAADLDDFLPRLLVKQGGDLVERPFSEEGCRNFSVAQDGESRGFTSLLTLDLGADDVSVQGDHVMSNWPVLYASADTLVVAEMAQDWWWFWGNEQYDEATNLHRFDISGADTVYTGSGRVEGVVTDQFQLDAHDGEIRVAATVGQWGRWWLAEPPPPTTHVSVLAGESSLSTIGKVAGIAPGERLWSARFEDDKAYLVTFENIDPLWTIDLSDGSAPRVIGELEVPGVSTYIHPIDGAHLLTIGIGGDQNGLDWSSTKLSLFDVSDFANPSLASSLELRPNVSGNNWTYSYSEATYEHKAFQYWGPMELLAIPLSTYRWWESGYEFVSELALVHAAAGDDLSVYGRIDHSSFYPGGDSFWGYRDIRRSVFMGEYIYAISDRGVTVHDLESLTLRASVSLEGTVGYPWY